MSERRTLINFQPLPDRKGAGLYRPIIEADIKAAAELAEKKILDRAQKYHVTGWREEEWSFDVVSHTVIGKLVMVRD